MRVWNIICTRILPIFLVLFHNKALNKETLTIVNNLRYYWKQGTEAKSVFVIMSSELDTVQSGGFKVN